MIIWPILEPDRATRLFPFLHPRPVEPQSTSIESAFSREMTESIEHCACKVAEAYLSGGSLETRQPNGKIPDIVVGTLLAEVVCDPRKKDGTKACRVETLRPGDPTPREVEDCPQVIEEALDRIAQSPQPVLEFLDFLETMVGYRRLGKGVSS